MLLKLLNAKRLKLVYYYRSSINSAISLQSIRIVNYCLFNEIRNIYVCSVVSSFFIYDQFIKA